MSEAVISAIVSATIALIVGSLSFIAARQQSRAAGQQTEIMQKQLDAAISAQAAEDRRFDASLDAEKERFRALQEAAHIQIGLAQAQVEQMERQTDEARQAQEEAVQAQVEAIRVQRDLFEFRRRWAQLDSVLEPAAEILWRGQLDEPLTIATIMDQGKSGQGLRNDLN